MSLPDKSSEIRIWIGFGQVIPEKMLRLRVNPHGVVSGDVLIHFPSDLTFMGVKDAARFRRQVMRSCTDLRRGKESDVCTATFKHVPDWQSLRDKLVALGITTLPNESVLPEPELLVLDGVAMVVELRDRTSYRAYQYSNRLSRSEPEAVAAAEIIRIVGEVFNEVNGT
ncbi:MAG TPA: hypothetical protein VLA99_14960 [Nitrospiraceae bacterium]|nr:hypothetical protein [Nitrospiraceae bacterium]